MTHRHFPIFSPVVLCALVLIALVHPAISFAQTAPSTAASTQPASPRAVFEDFFIAMSQGTADDLAPICFANDEISRQVLADFRDVSTAIAGLRKSTAAKFGEGMADIVLPQMAAPEESDKMKQTITGDKAVLESVTVGHTFLVRVDGQWKMDIAALLSNGSLPGNAHAYFTALAQAIRATTADIDRGRFDNAGAAREALLARQDGIREDAPAAATEPASPSQASSTTQPATMP